MKYSNTNNYSFRTSLVFLLGLFFFITTSSCGGSKKKEESKKQTDPEVLVNINKYLVNQDADKIRAYAKRRNWDMLTTQTGLWYMIYKKGNGKPAEVDKIATLKYTVSLLDGTLCYTSDSLGVKKFRIGKGGVERGLEEGILLLHEGDKARFIMPPYLAHGLTGDNERIPARAILVYDVELIQISDTL